jgi:hypothetical protein
MTEIEYYESLERQRVEILAKIKEMREKEVEINEKDTKTTDKTTESL